MGVVVGLYLVKDGFLCEGLLFGILVENVSVI